LNRGRESSVGIATVYVLDGPGIESLESMATATTCCDYMDSRSVYGLQVTRTQPPHAIGLHGVPETGKVQNNAPSTIERKGEISKHSVGGVR
jgi:hypothetical protein